MTDLIGGSQHHGAPSPLDVAAAGMVQSRYLMEQGRLVVDKTIEQAIAAYQTSSGARQMPRACGDVGRRERPGRRKTFSMIGQLDITASPAVLASLLATAIFPLVLAVLSRLPGLRERNALQFLASSTIIGGVWLLILSVAAGPAATGAELATSFMILASALLLYLEAWALLSRGYTIGLLLTLFHCKPPITEAELAASYRHGEGLGWIMRHRIGGLIAVRLVRRQDQLIVLTPAGTIVGMDQLHQLRYMLACRTLRKPRQFGSLRRQRDSAVGHVHFPDPKVGNFLGQS
jgi:hypothetical protein